MRLLTVSLVVAIAAGLVAASSSSEASPGSAAPTGSGDLSSSAEIGCSEVGPVKPRHEHLKRPPQTVKRDDRLLALVQTNCGSFTIGLDAARSPVLVNSFVHLARNGFFDGLTFYRVVPEFVIQGGDPRDNGTGGPGYHVVQPPPAHFRYRPGTVAMGKTAAEPSGFAGSDFFVVVGQGGTISPEYAVLGRVRSGMETIRGIDSLGTRKETPSQTVLIESVTIRSQPTGR
jgi:cyclophilin family peptidyl-prolyl cis-trans isomerase